MQRNFSDAKKELLKVRDDLEVELRELADRQTTALGQFEESERALVGAGFQHVHPMEELEDRRLAMRAKMVEYKAMSLGNVSAAPLTSELEALKKSMSETRERVSTIKALPSTSTSAANIQRSLLAQSR